MLKIDGMLFEAKIGLINISNVEASLKKASLTLSGKNEFFQIISLKPIASLKQLELAAEHTLYAFQNSQNFALKPSMEFLLRAAAEKQLNKVLDAFPLTEGENKVAVIALAENKKNLIKALKFAQSGLDFKENPALLEENLKQNTDFLIDWFKIYSKELESLNSENKQEALQKIILEKIALLNLLD